MWSPICTRPASTGFSVVARRAQKSAWVRPGGFLPGVLARAEATWGRLCQGPQLSLAAVMTGVLLATGVGVDAAVVAPAAGVAGGPLMPMVTVCGGAYSVPTMRVSADVSAVLLGVRMAPGSAAARVRALSARPLP